MNEDRFWILLAKQRFDELSDAEAQELKQLAEANPEQPGALAALDQLLHAPLKAYPNEQLDPDHWQRLAQQLEGEPSQENAVTTEVPVLPFAARRRWWWVAAAAGGLVVLLLGAYLYHRSFRGEEMPSMANKVSTEPDSKSQIQLPDGTMVWLNKRSRLSYNSGEFGVKQREVTLVGEAFFDVRKNAEIPFIIQTNAIKITVKGTAFNVKAYPESPTLETSLVRGLIEISTRKDPDRRILLRPNEKFILSLKKEKDSAMVQSADVQPAFESYLVKRLEIRPGAAPDETSWMNQELPFNDETLENLAPRLEAWYNIRIRIQDERLKQRRFSGVVRKETIEELLKVLQLTYPFAFERTGDLLVIGIPSPKTNRVMDK